MAKNTTPKVSTEEFIESVVEKILQKQAAQGQTSNYFTPSLVREYREALEDKISTEEYNKQTKDKLAVTSSCWNDEPNLAAKKASPVDDSLMSLEENIHHTYKLVQELVKKLEPVTFVAPAVDAAQDIKPQHSIPLCATIERNTNVVLNIKKEIEYLLEYVGV